MDYINLVISSTGAGANLGSRLRDARVARHYGLEDLAIVTGLTNAEISAIEDGTSTDAGHVERIEHVLV